MTSNIPLRSRMTQKSHVRFCRRVERGNFLGLVIGQEKNKELLISLINSILKFEVTSINVSTFIYKL